MSESDFETKDIFLKHKETGEVVGLHEVGFHDGKEWRRMEAWINYYDENLDFKASLSRVFGPIEEERDAFNADGDWEEINYENEKIIRKTSKI